MNQWWNTSLKKKTPYHGPLKWTVTMNDTSQQTTFQADRPNQYLRQYRDRTRCDFRNLETTVSSRCAPAQPHSQSHLREAKRVVGCLRAQVRHLRIVGTTAARWSPRRRWTDRWSRSSQWTRRWTLDRVPRRPAARRWSPRRPRRRRARTRARAAATSRPSHPTNSPGARPPRPNNSPPLIAPFAKSLGTISLSELPTKFSAAPLPTVQ